MGESRIRERLEVVLEQFIKQRRKNEEGTWVAFPPIMARWFRAHEEYPRLQKEDSVFLYRTQYLLRQEIGENDVSTEELRDFLVILNGHKMRLRARSKLLVIAGLLSIPALVLYKFIGNAETTLIFELFVAISAFLSWLMIHERGQNHEWLVAYEEFALLIEREIERETTRRSNR